MITHFTSDQHYQHRNIIAHAERPFEDLDEMDRVLEERYRAVVRDSDVVLWVGDVSFGDDLWTAALLKRLPGRKWLVRGNHDGTVTRCLRLGFELVVDSMHLLIAGHKVTVSHFPPIGTSVDERYAARRPPKPGPGDFVLHGHTHERARRVGSRIHVGVDAWDYAPVPIGEVERLVGAAERRVVSNDSV